MICETVTVDAVESDCIWVQATPKSACGACAARSGCGQRLLGKLMAKPNLVRVPLESTHGHNIKVGDEVEIGVSEYVLVSASLRLYLLPLLAMMLLGAFATVLQWGDWAVAASALVGLMLGSCAVRNHTRRHRNSYSPVLISC